MKRRNFLKTVAAGLVLSNLPDISCMRREDHPIKNWTWFRPMANFSIEDYQRFFSKMKVAGIDAIIPEIYNSYEARYQSAHLPVEEPWLETILPLAKAEGLEVHAWLWSMICNIRSVGEQHPDWFGVNGRGESALIKPAYVEHYRFMCPNHDGVREFVKRTVSELAQYEALDGIHLDYIRFPDVILAEGLQPKYNIVQDREYPEYDYCYCEVCRSEFKKQAGIDPLTLPDPAADAAWRQFRYDSITNLVNRELVPIARKHGKAITAAVFPNWQAVRQQWSRWELNAFMPMLYHNFYLADINWIRDQTAQEVASLPMGIPLYSGLFVFELSPEELSRAIAVSLGAGARGVVLFSAEALTDAHWESFEAAKRELKIKNCK